MNKKDKVINFTRKDIKEYLDKCIDYWRTQRDKKNNGIAKYYIDAFQSVRTSLFGELKM